MTKNLVTTLAIAMQFFFIPHSGFEALTAENVSPAYIGDRVLIEQEERPPVLTEVQKLQLQNAAQAVEFWKQANELWQLKAQQAASEFEKTRDVLQKLMSVTIPKGYQVNEKLELVKIPEGQVKIPELLKDK